MIIKLNKNHFDYLYLILPEEEKLRLEPLRNTGKDKQQVVIEIDDHELSKIYDWLNDELQKKGFDINYELNYEGMLLEDLIDAFMQGYK